MNHEAPPFTRASARRIERLPENQLEELRRYVAARGLERDRVCRPGPKRAAGLGPLPGMICAGTRRFERFQDKSTLDDLSLVTVGYCARKDATSCKDSQLITRSVSAVAVRNA